MAAILVGGISWYSSRPKAWNESAFRVKFAEPVYRHGRDFKVENVLLEYIVTNTTLNDYTLGGDNTLMILDKGSLESHVNYQCPPTVIPAGQSVKVALVVPPGYNTGFQVDGFVFFDYSNRYKVTFPKPNSPKPDKNAPNDWVNVK